MRTGLGGASPSRRATVVLAGLLALAAGSNALPGRTREVPTPPDAATVAAVLDGDTVKVRFGDGSERKVRLIGIDSPELGDERESVRFMAYVAKRFAFLKLYRRDVRLSYDWQLEDKYGRLLAFLTVGEGTLFNELILREGFATRFRAFPFKPELMKRFEAAESEARREGKGLWARSDAPPVSPAEASGMTGRLASVRMACASVEVRRPFMVLVPAGREIEVLVPDRRRADFPGLEAMAGKVLLVKGLVEEFEGRPQIMVDVPLQLKVLPMARIVDRPSRPGL
jgi:micrococcal nuclease